MEFVRIDTSDLPPEEHEAAHSIEHNLHGLRLIADEFRQSVNLFLFAHGRKLLAQQGGRSDEVFGLIAWMRIAGRNGALMAYSFSELMRATSGLKAPGVWAKADLASRQKATKLFSNEFPGIHGIRHSAAHPGELMKSPQQTRKHGARKSISKMGMHFGAGAYVEAMIHAGDDHMTFSGSFNGELEQYELSMHKADVLDSAAQHYAKTFYPLRNDADVLYEAAWNLERQRQPQQDQTTHPPWWHNLLQQ